MKKEINLRPTTLEQYSGQDQIKKALTFYIKAAKMRQECLDHTVIFGSSGLGKTTLAQIIANEMDSEIKTVSAPVIKTVEDIRAILLSLQENQILFIDEIHRLSKKIEEVLYFAMEDYVLDIEVEGVKERTNLPRFTLIGATTSNGMLSEPLRNRFHITIELVPYKANNLAQIIQASAKRLGREITLEDASKIAKRSRGVPRVANGFIKRVRDVADVMNNGVINSEILDQTFDVLGIDDNGLTNQDRRYLNTLVRYNMKPVGIDTLCSALNDDKRTIEETVEPYLIQKGLVSKTPRGRVVTKEAIELLKVTK